MIRLIYTSMFLGKTKFARVLAVLQCWSCFSLDLAANLVLVLLVPAPSWSCSKSRKTARPRTIMIINTKCFLAYLIRSSITDLVHIFIYNRMIYGNSKSIRWGCTLLFILLCGTADDKQKRMKYSNICTNAYKFPKSNILGYINLLNLITSFCKHRKTINIDSHNMAVDQIRNINLTFFTFLCMHIDKAMHLIMHCPYECKDCNTIYTSCVLNLYTIISLYSL
ncbi:hypothetical protein AGLY_014754 [Aphis glycines]|uniref:Uncharacterized protein n=1 Tax=Aphis glycines TaxID=307491 RepID=A0A6G0T3C8_APHGL|nr:hypothetical protein AGLY_014754 [Aphis glycines]